MNKELFTYLKAYSVNPEKVNRIIVSIFLQSNNIDDCKNELISSLRIQENDEDFHEFRKISEEFKISSIEDLIEAFEFVISPEEKVVTGAVYTPDFIREYIVNETIDESMLIDGSFKVGDPACGCSGFLFTAARKIRKISGRSYKEIFSENLFGLDIQEFAIKRSEILLASVAIVDGEDEQEFKFNLYQGNALNFDWSEVVSNFHGFDVILGNPPYVCSRNIDDESMNLIFNWSVSKTGHPDLYIPFFEIGITALKDKGKLGYITMNTFFKSLNGRALRQYFQTNRYKINILDYGTLQIFRSKSTYTCICIIEKSPSDLINYVRLNNLDSLVLDCFKFQKIFYEQLNYEKGWNLQEIELLNKIEATGTPFGKKFATSNGIATLKNDVYIFDPIDENESFLFLHNGETYPIEKDVCLDIINPNKLTQLDTIEPLRRKIIFPYRVLEGKTGIIPEDEFQELFPNAYEYLLSKRSILAERDKGKGKDYPIWYSYGRNQSLEPYKFKLFFPHITPSIPNYVINAEPNLLFVNGLAIIRNNEADLLFLKKIMSSRLFWFYVSNSSKPYGSGYYSLSRNYIKNFGIYEFSETQIKHLMNLKSKEAIDEYLEDIYGIKLSSIISVESDSTSTLLGPINGKQLNPAEKYEVLFE